MNEYLLPHKEQFCNTLDTKFVRTAQNFKRRINRVGHGAGGPLLYFYFHFFKYLLNEPILSNPIQFNPITQYTLHMHHTP